MRDNKLQPREFNVPLECKERDEILRYVSRNNSNNKSFDDIRKERPRSQPPAKFSFLSGIHPDLDEALCEIQSPDSCSHCSDQRKRMNDKPSPGKASLAFFDERRSTRGNYRKDRTLSERSSIDDKSKENIILDEFEMKGFDMKQETSISGSTISYLGLRVNEQADSVVDSESSKPKEITCAKILNESVDSLPFSVDGMERAKRRIKSQAAKIRDLEDKLKKAASTNGYTFEINEGEQANVKKVMSPEERLEAHIERKRLENKYKEKTGKWDAPPPVKYENMTAKVKRKDKLVDRLVLDPKQRRIQDEVSKRMKQSLEKFEKAASDDEQLNEEGGDLPLNRRLKHVKTSRTKSRNNNTDVSVNKMPTNLMTRLNMSLKDRRKVKKNEDQITDDLKRALRGHRIHKKDWRMSREFDIEKSGSSSSDEGDLDFPCNGNLKELAQCETCMSEIDCEEDVDSPGTYYCRKCWDEYECAPTQANLLMEDDQNSLYGGQEEYSPRQKSRYKLTKKEAYSDEALWIIHDDPKLGGRLTWSGSKKTNCLIETKDPSSKNCVRILHGQIDYCGAVLGSGIGNQSVQETDRGAECIRISNIKGFVIDHNSVETRLAKNKSIYEFRLNQTDAIHFTGQDCKMRLQDFYNGCDGAVDVILAPQCSPGGWYPQREVASNSRKIAPQFRSNGLGYIRLGDDMGNHGLAFLSSDSCHSFFSTTEAVNPFESNAKFLKTTSSLTVDDRCKSNISKKVKSIRKRSDSVKVQTSQNSRLGVDLDDSSCSLSSVSSCAGDNEHSVSAGVLLKELQNFEVSKDVKWKEKAELLISLGKAIGRPQGRGTCTNALNYIQDIISSKNVNINVLRNALFVVEKIGDSMKHELVYHISWKTILIEILKLLKNKQVANGAKEILRNLHGKCFTLGNSIVAVSHVLGMGKSSANHRKSTGSLKQVPANKSNQSMQKSNTVEIIEWLAATTETERIMEEINPMIDESGLSQLATFFSSHGSHRDAKCRKNALDGMLHTVLYGIERLRMDKSDALKLFLDIKTLNPRSWTRLTKSVNHAMKDKRINY